MNKQEFLNLLEEGLHGLPQEEIKERLNFYSEIIDDRIEEGCSEEDAITEIGAVNDIIFQIVDEISLYQLVKEKVKPKRRLRVWEIILLAVGSPVWFSLAIAAFAVTFSLYISLWSVIVSLWAAFASVACCAIGGVIGGIWFVFGGKAFSGIAMLGAGVFCAGLSIFLFFGCRAATKGVLQLTKKMILGLKSLFIRKECAR